MKLLLYFVLCFIIFSITFILILPRLCSHLPYSYYFTEEPNSHKIQNLIFKTNEKRLNNSRYFLAHHNSTLLQHDSIDIAVGIITVSRGKLAEGDIGYLTQTVASLLMQETGVILSKRKYFICNVDSNPDNHKDAKFLSKYMTMFVKTKPSDNNLDLFEKEKEDYIFCLIQAAHLKPKYVVLLEDDILLKPSTLNTLTQIINLLNNRLIKDNWLFIKGYYPDKWSGYSYSFTTILEMTVLSLIGGSINYSIMCKLNSIKISRYLSLFSFIIGAFYLSTLCYVIGRQYLVGLRQYFTFTHHLIQSPGCCTQFMLYPTVHIDKFQSLLQSMTCSKSYSVDLAIDVISDVMKLNKWLVEPNLVKHIGYYSTLRANVKSAAEFL